MSWPGHPGQDIYALFSYFRTRLWYAKIPHIFSGAMRIALLVGRTLGGRTPGSSNSSTLQVLLFQPFAPKMNFYNCMLVYGTAGLQVVLCTVDVRTYVLTYVHQFVACISSSSVANSLRTGCGRLLMRPISSFSLSPAFFQPSECDSPHSCQSLRSYHCLSDRRCFRVDGNPSLATIWRLTLPRFGHSPSACDQPDLNRLSNRAWQTDSRCVATVVADSRTPLGVPRCCGS